jgi:hypothetical protein
MPKVATGLFVVISRTSTSQFEPGYLPFGVVTTRNPPRCLATTSPTLYVSLIAHRSHKPNGPRLFLKRRKVYR